MDNSDKWTCLVFNPVVTDSQGLADNKLWKHNKQKQSAAIVKFHTLLTAEIKEFKESGA